MRRAIGNTGISVNAIGLGAMPLSIQGRPDERTALAVIDSFLDAGGDFIDTAISYCFDNHDLGHSERLIAKALAARGRKDVIVATKGGLTRPDGRWEVDADPVWLRRCCEQSVRDLGGPIPLYYLHAVDTLVPFADSLGALVRLRDAGLIGAIGLSNVSAKQLDEAFEITPIAAVQNRCNFYERRDLDSGLVERCRQAHVAYVPYSPVGGQFGHHRLGRDAALVEIAAKHESSAYAVALAWLLERGEHIVPIPGASKVASIEDSLRATAITLDAADLDALNPQSWGRDQGA
jgi:aryl-alcohol dehydrogenase-like predicted oxidoreductase